MQRLSRLPGLQRLSRMSALRKWTDDIDLKNSHSTVRIEAVQAMLASK